MKRVPVIALALVFFMPASTVLSAPKKASNGEACNSSGEKRRTGTDAATGEKLDCLWDYCTYCGTTGGQIDCSILKTEFSNARDCKAAARGAGMNVLPGTISPGVFEQQDAPTRPRLPDRVAPGIKTME